MGQIFFMIGGLMGFLGVALGAFAAHALRAKLDPGQLAGFEVGVRYQMYHALALLAVGLLHTRWPGVVVTISGWLFVAGAVLFSGSLYALCLRGARWLRLVTPIGGCALLAGWLCLAWAALRK